jgi:hypothetical protein
VHRWLATAGLVLAVSACGYRFVRHEASGSGADARVAIAGLRNDSFEPGLESVMNDALRREFVRRGALRVVDDPDGADLVIGGAVLPLLWSARSFSSVNFAIEYEVTLRLRLEVARSDGEKIPLDATAITESELYLASSDVEVTRKNREEALRRVAAALAGRVHDVLVETATP